MRRIFNTNKLEQYLEEGSPRVNGYLQSGSSSVICSIFDVQDELKILGNIAEIGVFHGKLFILLCHSIREGERAFAIDVFNSEPYIQGIKTPQDRRAFSQKNLLRNLKINEIGADLTHLITTNSQKLTPFNFKQIIDNKEIRLFSIDGDHSREGVRHDLNLAVSSLSKGGIILVDDLFNVLCPSLTEGIIDFFNNDNTKRVAPIAIIAANGPVQTGATKLVLADSAYTNHYKAYLQLLNQTNYSHAENFLGYPNVLIFEFKDEPILYSLNDDVRLAVTEFLKNL